MTLYHYCSNRTLLSILSGRSVWASEFSLSNDTLEGKWLRVVLSDYFTERGMSASDKEEVLPHLDSLMALMGGTGFCMSEESDLLSQWRGYADDGCGVSLGFNREYFETLGNLKRDRNDAFNASLTKVEYDPRRQKELIAEHADAIVELVSKGVLRQPSLLLYDEDKEKQRREAFRSMRLRFFIFFFHLYTLKNPAFAEEREWRLISHILASQHSDRAKQLSDMEFRSSRDRIVPFRSIMLEDIGLPAITEVVLGPKNITPEEVIDAILRKYNWPDVQIKRSSASYRGW
jgi:hypothetical protein